MGNFLRSAVCARFPRSKGGERREEAAHTKRELSQLETVGTVPLVVRRRSMRVFYVREFTMSPIVR